ncbi:MAG: HesA/MoeB/ThiF family protein [Actinomadura sp.]
MWSLLESMDGTRTVDQIVTRVGDLHPAASADSVRAGLDRLVGSGYIEDAGAPDPAVLTDRDKERYSRSRRFFRWLDLIPRANSWEPQLALRAARVTVVGVGGTGGHAAQALAASGVGRLHCVDHDVVELSNLNRQILYCEDDIGASKVETAVSRLRRLNSDIEITGAELRIEGVSDLARLAADCDVLVLAADRPPEIRAWTNRACLAEGTPWVHSGYHGPLVTVGTFVPGIGACWECLQESDDERHRAMGTNPADADAPYRRAALANAVCAPSAGLCGNLAAHAALALLTGVPRWPVGEIHAINLVAIGEHLVVDDARRPGCQACGKT